MARNDRHTLESGVECNRAQTDDDIADIGQNKDPVVCLVDAVLNALDP